jgi:hypothetical protein
VILEPDQYPAAPVYDLLAAAARGRTGLDRKWLGAILDRGEEAIPDLLRFGLEDRDGDRIDLDEDLMAMFRHLRTPRALPYYIKLLRNDPMDAADELLEAFLQFPAEALEPLLGLYDELEADEREEVAFLLAALKVRDQRVFDRLLERLGDDPADAAFCLGVYGDPAARPHLEALMESLADDPDASFVRESARKALEELGEDLPAPDLPQEDIRKAGHRSSN